MTEGLTKTQKRRQFAMAKAKRDHRSLILLLGDKCKHCGKGWEEAPLQIDHVHGRPFQFRNRSSLVRGIRWDERVKRYWREWYDDPESLQVLCRPCNEDKGRRTLQAQREAEAALDCPF